MKKPQYNSILIVGPTASGKSDVAILLAKKLNGEIINTDSMQIYDEMQIGTARPTTQEQGGVPHHLFGFLPIDSEYSVSLYRKDAENSFNEILSRKHLPIFVGGTGLYAHSLISNLSYGNSMKDEALRAKYNEMAEKEGKEAVYKVLLELDPTAAEKISANDIKRVIRAIEIYTLSNEKKSDIDTMQDVMQSPIKPLIVGINYPREQLYDRINLRVDKMIEKGLLQEASQIYNKHLGDTQSICAIAYKELFPYFKGEKTLDECVDLLKQKTRNYAKRQITWFKKTPNLIWFDRSQKSDSEIVNEIIKLYKK